MRYTTPNIEVFEVAVDRGYGDSVLLPGFGTENDELVYYTCSQYKRAGLPLRGLAFFRLKSHVK